MIAVLAGFCCGPRNGSCRNGDHAAGEPSWRSPLDVFRHAGPSSPSPLDRQFSHTDPRGPDGDDEQVGDVALQGLVDQESHAEAGSGNVA